MRDTHDLIRELRKQQPSTELAQRAAKELDFLVRAIDQLRTETVRLAEENYQFMEFLADANDAFDECTGDYGKELVADEPWRAFRYNLLNRNEDVA